MVEINKTVDKAKQKALWMAGYGFRILFEMQYGSEYQLIMNTAHRHTELPLRWKKKVFVQHLAWGREKHRCSPKDTLSLFTDESSALYR